MKRLPDKTVERLSQYRRALLASVSEGKKHIFSHELAALIHITSVQVRRDIMLIGYSGTLRQGYDIRELIDTIGKIIDSKEGQKVAVIGIGNLGRAIIGYLSGKRTKLTVVAGFDTNPEKVDRTYAGVWCYDFNRLQEVIKNENVAIGIITVPASEVARVAEALIASGIKGILNYTSKPINVPDTVYLEEYDILTSLEKIAYFSK
jgi:redox-sensing transcriptional repressor